MELLDALGAIETGIARLEGLDLRALDANTLRPGCLKSKRLIDRLRAVQARMMTEADACGAAIGSGSRDTASWLADQTNSSLGDAKAQMQLGDTLTANPAIAAAIADESVSVAAVEAVQPVLNDPDLPSAETAAALLPDLFGVGPREAKRLAEAHASAHRTADDAEQRRARLYARRSLTFRDASDGMVEGRLLLTPLDARAVRNAITHIIGKPNKDDERTSEQRAADALVALCDAYAKGTVTGGLEKPTIVMVHRKDTGATTTTFDEQLTAMELVQACCDANVHDALQDTDGEILNLGRAVRTATRAQRLALAVRDLRCRWPGCEMPPGWCDAHHIIEWDPDGLTDLINLVLLCRHHHTTTHLPGYSINGDATHLVINLPDGRVIVSAPPKPTAPARAGTLFDQESSG